MNPVLAGCVTVCHRVAGFRAYWQQLVTIRRMVPGKGIEPSRPCGHRILSPARLPVPPTRRSLSVSHALELEVGAGTVDRCWASVLGDCEGPLSDEHSVSGGLFDDPLLKVSGFDWCKGIVKEIPRDRLVRRILCKGHNERLSVVDGAAVQAVKVFDECMRLEEARKKMRPRWWNVSSFQINGRDLERWLLKTTINLTFNRDQMLGPSAKESGKPPEELVQIAFGNESFSDKRGLYVLSAQGYTANNSDRISFVPWGQGKFVNGMVVSLRGFLFMLCLIPTGLDRNQVLDTPIRGLDPEQKVDRMNLNPNYHPKAFVSRSGKYVSSKIVFSW